MSQVAEKLDYDVVIAGGGMVGTSLALALAPLGIRIAVVEPVPRSAMAQPSFDDRTTALSRSTQRMYEAMNLWSSIASASTPITHIHVSDQGRFGFSHIDADEQGVEALGYVVVNRVLGSVLQDALDAAEVTQHCPAKIVAAQPYDDRIEVTVERADAARSVLTAAMLVAADGANSSIRELLGIGSRRTDYGQTAIIGNLQTELPIENRAFERFTEHGPLALLPLTEGRSGFVWTVVTDAAERVMALDDTAFVAGLQEAFGNRLGEFTKVGQRVAYPLVLTRADRVTAQRAVLIGNSAHGLHPVAAQGFNLGLRDVAALCDCVADSLAAARRQATHADPGSTDLLERYAAWRRGDQRKLVRFTDGLVRLFGRTDPVVRTLRNIGMIGFDLVPGVRPLFARHTMGLAGRLPRLSRGVPLV